MRKRPTHAALSPLISVLAPGGVGVMPTDTIYGIVGLAHNRATVRRIYALRHRNPKKPLIVLVGDVRDIARFGVQLDRGVKKFLAKVWPGKVSVILPIASGRTAAAAKFRYLHRGTRSLAFRLPKDAWLRAFLRRTGPLVAPSANIEGEPPAKTVREAKSAFGDHVDFYVDAGRLVSKASTLVSIRKGNVEVLRKGAVNLVV